MRFHRCLHAGLSASLLYKEIACCSISSDITRVHDRKKYILIVNIFFYQVEDHDHVSPANPGSPPLLPVKPRVIVMKKGGHDGKVQVDHEYTIHDRSKKSTAVVSSAVVSSARTVAEPVNAEPTTNILFLCDVCKDVFANLKLLKVCINTQLFHQSLHLVYWY